MLRVLPRLEGSRYGPDAMPAPPAATPPPRSPFGDRTNALAQRAPPSESPAPGKQKQPPPSERRASALYTENPNFAGSRTPADPEPGLLLELRSELGTTPPPAPILGAAPRELSLRSVVAIAVASALLGAMFTCDACAPPPRGPQHI